ncbi:hypothetical protein EDB85DRAFT_1890457 [Lactarius pseudohatsudake]|nr:hypothetical protein EDB85DRAFT_1890457 [Lactarius pseudohatsudake]
MTDWKSPAVVTAEYFALVKLYHAIWGVLLWEFVVNIGFEYSVFTGRRKFRSSFLVRCVQPAQTGMRDDELKLVHTALLGDSVVPFVQRYYYTRGIRLSKPDQLPVSASALIVLRIAAIWGLNKIAISIASAAWLANTGALIHSLAVLRGTWSGGLCIVTNTSETKTNILVTFITDLVLLALMLIGLLRWENARQRDGVWWLLYTQHAP